MRHESLNRVLVGLAAAGLLAVVLATVPGCGFLAGLLSDPLPIRLASTDPIVECRMRVRRAADSLEEVPSSAQAPFRTTYYHARDCAGGGEFGFDSREQIEEDWRRFVASRIDELAQANEIPFAAPDFAIEDWCEVPGTRTCTETEESILDCVGTGVAAAEPLALCAAEGVALEVSCEGEATCLDFGDVPTVFRDPDGVVPPVGTGASRIVTVTHPGGPDAPPALLLGLDGTLDPVTAPADFEIPVEDAAAEPLNGCYSTVDDPLELQPGGSCSFVVLFEPQEAGEHRAGLRDDPLGPELEIAGQGVGGSLTLEQENADARGRLCFDELVDLASDPPCTVARTVTLINDAADAATGVVAVRAITVSNTNPGPGGVVDPADHFFQVETAAPFAVVDGQSVPISILWCHTDAEENDNATLQIETGGSDTPVYTVDLRRRPDAAGPCA